MKKSNELSISDRFKNEGLFVDFKDYLNLSIEDRADPIIATRALKEGLDCDENVENYDNDLKSIFNAVPLHLRENAEFLTNVFNSISEDYRSKMGFIPDLPEELLSNKILVLSFLKVYNKAFSLIDYNLQDDDDVVLCATKNDGGMISCASERCQNSRHIQAQIICNSQSWDIYKIPKEIIDTELMRKIYAISPSRLLWLKESSAFKNNMFNAISFMTEALECSDQPNSFFLKHLKASDSELLEMEVNIENLTDGDDFSMLVNSDRRGFDDLQEDMLFQRRVVEHLSDKLPLAELKESECKSTFFKEDILDRRELLEIKQEQVPEIRAKKDRRLSF